MDAQGLFFGDSEFGNVSFSRRIGRKPWKNRASWVLKKSTPPQVSNLQICENIKNIKNMKMVMKWPPSGQKYVLIPQICIVFQMQSSGYVKNIPYICKMTTNGQKHTKTTKNVKNPIYIYIYTNSWSTAKRPLLVCHHTYAINIWSNMIKYDHVHGPVL